MVRVAKICSHPLLISNIGFDGMEMRKLELRPVIFASFANSLFVLDFKRTLKVVLVFGMNTL